MKKTTKNKIINTVGSFFMLAAIFASGISVVRADDASNQNASSTPSNASSTSSQTVIDLHLLNPIASTDTTEGVNSLPEFFHKAVDIMIKIGIPLVAMAIVYSGLLFVTARGSDEGINTAKQVFTYAIIGGLILLASWLVAGAIKDALTSLAYAG